jgi:adenylate cyclase
LPESHDTALVIRYVFVAPIYVLGVALAFIPRTQKGLPVYTIVAALAVTLGLAAVMAVSEPTEPGDDLYFVAIVVVAFAVYVLVNLRFWTALVVGILVLAVFEIGTLAFGDLSDAESLQSFLAANFFIVAAQVLGLVSAYRLEFSARRDFLLTRALQEEQRQTDALLLNILPQEIASLLKQERRTVAASYDNSNVLFADIVGFTPMTENLPPEELVALLNEVFSYFDGLAAKYRVEKIKTIGDCYMVAAGVPVERPDHAQVLARLALEAQAYLSKNEFSGRRLSMRMGINSGPVVAGVIGRSKFSYDLWGDTVNTASRMEAQGVHACIQITRETYALLRDEFVCEYGGQVAVKGKGEMDVWHVVAMRADGANGLAEPGGALPTSSVATAPPA